jgi:hypothetical protein
MLPSPPPSAAPATAPTTSASPTSATAPSRATAAVGGRIASVVRPHRAGIGGTVWIVASRYGAVWIAPSPCSAGHRSHSGWPSSVESWHFTHLLLSLAKLRLPRHRPPGQMKKFAFSRNPALLLSCHLGSTLGASNLVARLSYLVRYLVTAVGADAVAAWPCRFGTSHAARPASSSLSSAALSTSLSSTHPSHLLLCN